MPRVKFITTGHSHMAGNFSAGDTYTGDEAVCRHFVEDARCAEWAEVQAPGPVAEAAAAAQAEAAAAAQAEAAAAAQAEAAAAAPAEAAAAAPAEAAKATGTRASRRS